MASVKFRGLLMLVLAAALCLLAPLPAIAEEAKPEVARPTAPRGPTVGKWSATSTGGMVVAGGAEAVDAGIETLASGGNAADAAAAVILALSVTDANQFCFGGEVPILAYSADRRLVETIAGQGAAPRLATREHFASLGGIPKTGLAPAAVPATLDACLTLLDRHGSKSFAEAATPALRILDRHEHAWHAALATTLRRIIAAESTAADVRQGLRRAADCFYRGEIARELDAWSRANGGLLRYADLAAHVTRVEEPASAEYRGRRIYKCGFWTQGPCLLESLSLLEGFGLETLPPGGAEAIHLSAEALKLGLADRDAWYGDPLFCELPLAHLLTSDYAAARRTLIDPAAASLSLRPGALAAHSPAEQPPPAGGDDAPQDTTTCLVADRHGNVIAATPSGWSGTLCPPLGIWLGTRLQSFNLQPGHPNCIEPGKRPRITLTPTIVLEHDLPAMAVSVAGGDHQDQVTLQMLVNLIDFQMTAEQAVAAPRFVTDHHIGSFGQTPARLGSLTLGGEVSDAVVMELKRRGHDVKQDKGRPAVPTVLVFDRAKGIVHGAGDPAHGRHAAGE